MLRNRRERGWRGKRRGGRVDGRGEDAEEEEATRQKKRGGEGLRGTGDTRERGLRVGRGDRKGEGGGG